MAQGVGEWVAVLLGVVVIVGTVVSVGVSVAVGPVVGVWVGVSVIAGVRVIVGDQVGVTTSGQLGEPRMLRLYAEQPMPGLTSATTTVNRPRAQQDISNE